MKWFIWLLLCCGPPAIVWFKARSPLRLLVVTVGLSAGLYVLVGGFMSITGASRWMIETSGTVFGAIGVIIAYAIAILANESEKEKPTLWKKRTETLCPNCAAFVSKTDVRCSSCGETL